MSDRGETLPSAPEKAPGLLLVVPLCRLSGGGPQPVHKNEPRPTPDLIRSVICYLTLTLDFDLSAAAASSAGSAKAITASPSSKLEPGLPPKP
jgi:hypothetical protein